MSRAATSRLKVNPPLGSPPTLEWRAVGDLGIDAAYQRAITAATSQTLIRRIAQFWDWGLCQPLAVARRGDGALMVVDGQHRLEAARMRRDIPHLPCVITAYANSGDEAAAFVALNQQRRPLNALDIYKAALAAGDDTAVAIDAALASAGLAIAPHNNYTAWKPGMVSNVGGIIAAYRKHGDEITRLALSMMARAFEGTVLRYCGTLFSGIVALVAMEVGDWIKDGGTAATWAEGEFAGPMRDMLAAVPQSEWMAEIKNERAKGDAKWAVCSANVMASAWVELLDSYFEEDEAA